MPVALPVQYTYARNATITQAKKGAFGSDIRLTGLKGNMNADQPWTAIDGLYFVVVSMSTCGYGDVLCQD